MRIMRIALAIASLLLLAGSLAVALGPGHRYRSQYVNHAYEIDRTPFEATEIPARNQALDDVQRLLTNQDRHLKASNTSWACLAASWLALAGLAGSYAFSNRRASKQNDASR